MLIEEVDGFDAETLERAFDGLFDVLGATIDTGSARAIVGAAEIESEFGGDDCLLAEGREGFADEIFVCEWAIDFGGVE